MKTKILLFIGAVAFLLSACIKNKNYKTYTIYRPEYSVKQSVKDAARFAPAQELKDLGNFVLYNNTMFVNEKNKGIHVVDYTNATNPVNKGFIPIPGNTGVSIKNNVLYADCYCELFVFKINSNDDIQLQDVIPNAFLSRVGYNSYDHSSIELNWIKKDTTVLLDAGGGYYCPNCVSYEDMMYLSSSSSGASSNVPSGGNSVGGSMAVFAIVNDYLYTVDNSNLYAFSLSNPLKPVRTNSQYVNWNVQTIFPFKDKLFLGSMSGMYIYGLQNPASPNYISVFSHARVCDPVIVDDNYAYVTLRNGTACNGFVNQLDVVNITDVTKPVLLKSFAFSNPRGLSKDGNVMFVCDGNSGLRVIDASDVNNLVTKQTITDGEMMDVVAYNKLAVVMLTNAIKFYSYDQQFNVSLLGSLTKN